MEQSVAIVNTLGKSLFQIEDASSNKVAVIVDENTKLHCYPILKPYLPEGHHLIEIRSGEENKNTTTCGFIWEELTKLQFNRKSMVINLGGGVIGDMGGFCAATYKRGIPFIQVPTTLLAQVDASIGGKLGIDFNNLKNHIGVFQIPNRVVIYPTLIETLSLRELRSGYAEVLKHALIADKEAWSLLTEKTLNEQDWFTVISKSYKIKYDIVEADPKEKGLRKVLNFGHTIGHAIESALLETPERKLLHGEAIAVGMICEAYLSHKIGNLSNALLKELSDYILSVYGKVELETSEFNGFIQLMKQDKKNESDGINFSLLDTIGESTFNNVASETLIEASLKYYVSL